MHTRAPGLRVKRQHDEHAPGRALRVKELRRHAQKLHLNHLADAVVIGAVQFEHPPPARARQRHRRALGLEATDLFGAQAKEAQLPIPAALARQEHNVVQAVGVAIFPCIVALGVEIRMQRVKRRQIGARPERAQCMLLARLYIRLRLDAPLKLGLLKGLDLEAALGTARRGQAARRKRNHGLREHDDAVEVALGVRTLGKVEARHTGQRRQKRGGVGERVAKLREQAR